MLDCTLTGGGLCECTFVHGMWKKLYHADYSVNVTRQENFDMPLLTRGLLRKS